MLSMDRAKPLSNVFSFVFCPPEILHVLMTQILRKMQKHDSAKKKQKKNRPFGNGLI